MKPTVHNIIGNKASCCPSGIYSIYKKKEKKKKKKRQLFFITICHTSEIPALQVVFRLWPPVISNLFSLLSVLYTGGGGGGGFVGHF